MFVMKEGEIVEMGSVQKILDTPSDAYTQTLINVANRK
jgi:ABC-type microcin C transport system duplicated ATPase subunit YejF